MQPWEQFGANLRQRRRQAGLSQMELSARSHLHFTEISRLERGERDPRLSTIARVAAGLGIRPAELLDDIG